VSVLAQAPAPAAPVVGSVGLNIGIFVVFIGITLIFVYRASRTNRTASDYYAAGR
jgi:cation/acetate symporter